MYKTLTYCNDGCDHGSKLNSNKQMTQDARVLPGAGLSPPHVVVRTKQVISTLSSVRTTQNGHTTTIYIRVDISSSLDNRPFIDLISRASAALTRNAR